MRVVFSGGGTGGHLYPGLAIARALVRLRGDVEPHFVGAARGIERDVLPRQEFPFTLLDAHPLYRSRPWENWRTLLGVMSGWAQMDEIARSGRPAMAVGTGGYASIIPLVWARARRVPIVQHIGDAFPGLSARLVARWSRECYLGFAGAEAHLPGARGRCYATGNPIEPPPEPRPGRAALLAEWRLAPDARVLLAFGGSQGARAINDAVAAWVRSGIPDGWSVLWATGTRHYSEYRQFDGARVRVTDYLSPIANAYAVSDLALVRGGTMGMAELCAWGIPMIVVPLPTAAADHQSWNARALEADGAGIHVPQAQFSAERLGETVAGLIGDPSRLASLADGARRRARPQAAADIARRIAALLPS